MRVAITGSSGLIGSALSHRLEALGHEAVPVVRGAPVGKRDRLVAGRGPHRAHALEGVDAVVHLAGAGIGDHRWTDDYKRVLLESRTKGTTLLAEAIAATENGPNVLLSGSAIGFYGARGDEELDETSSAGTGFLADLTVQWETSTAPAAAAGVRVVFLRTGIVLSADGGALKKQLPLFKLGAGGTIGSGDQWQSWISIDDEVAAIVHLLTADIAGPVNLTAPTPVTQARRSPTHSARCCSRPTFLPIPKFGPKLLLGGELAENLLFTGQKVLPRVLAR